VLQFIIRRGLKALVTMYVVVTAVFFFTRITGNPFDREFATQGLTPEMQRELEEYYGFDEPLWKQYFIYLGGLLHGYAGRSVFREGQLVTVAYAHALVKTGKLVIWCIPLGLLTGIPLGIIGAIKKDKAAGQAAMAAAFVGYAFPNFIIAIGLILVFSYILGWLPSMGDATPAHFIMPIIALSVRRMASISRFTRSSMLDVLSQDYIRTARGKGLSERIVTFKHALRNGLIPVVTIFGTQLASLLAGSMIIETIFAWPGFGYTLIRGVQDRDYAVVQFGVLITATIVIVANLLVDIAYGVIDPRIRTEA
jgi:ABC-type dipeptide/oligopeptide/nickel transport system permease component